MELALATAIGVLTAIGIYLLLRARSFDVILGMTFLSYATNLLIFAGGRVVQGKAPVLQDGDQVLAESGAILDYLVDRYDTQRVLSPSPVPADSAERIAYRYWLHYAEGSAMPPLLLTLVVGRIRSAPMPFFARPIARSIADKAERGFIGPQRRLHLDWMERRLAESPWFAGERFSAADIQMSFPIQAAAARGGGLDDKPALRGFLERIGQRPAYQRAEAHGGALQALRGD
ncbi:MAG TPA: glutathione S-transferase [Stenotrophomonas sp.]|nr:glutathione S-transferase [Stenotrophomonas sp.]